MASRLHILLFDVDGTLLLSGGAGGRALEEAFEALFGAAGAMEGVRAHGRTDALICADMFRNGLGREGTEEEIRRLLDRYLERLPGAVAESADYRLLPGIPEVLDALGEREDVALGLGTGNIERGARIKLERGELNRYFPFGGFGSDAADRAGLIEAGFRRGEERSRERSPGAEIVRWVVGDTRLDVEAGRAAGARVVAVATGGDSLEELARAGPDHLFPDFAGGNGLPALLDGG
ncbi:MAG: HAD hydrolase-like protein [bacterium]